jgi:hypothetical protein
MTTPARLAPVLLLAALVAGLTAASARAGLLVASASNCPATSLSEAFLHWGDTAEYTLVPGGKFASGSPAWTLTGGAKVVAGGDGYTLGGSTSTSSLSLPTGSKATSPAMCVGVGNIDMRFLARNTGAATAALAGSVEFETSLGATTSLSIGTFTASGTWQPVAPDLIVANLLPLLPGNETPVAFSFTPVGSGGNWQIADI